MTAAASIYVLPRNVTVTALGRRWTNFTLFLVIVGRNHYFFSARMITKYLNCSVHKSYLQFLSNFRVINDFKQYPLRVDSPAIVY